MENFALKIELSKNILKEFVNFENKYINILKEFTENVKNYIIYYSKKEGFDLSKGVISSYLLYINYYLQQRIKNIEDNMILIKENYDTFEKYINKQNVSIIKELDDDKENIIRLNEKINKAKAIYDEKMQIIEKSFVAFEQCQKKNEINDLMIKKKTEDIKIAKNAENNYLNLIEKINDLRTSYFKKLSNFILNYRKFNSLEVQNFSNLYSILFKIHEIELNQIQNGKKYFENNINQAYEELKVPFPNIDNINYNYAFIPYFPFSYSKINDDNDKIFFNSINNLQKEFPKLSNDIINEKELNNFIKFSNIIGNVGFYCQTVNDEDIESLKVYFKEKKYREKFILYLNQKRGNTKLFQDPKAFENICKIFKILFENFEPNEHDYINYAILLSQTFYSEINSEKHFIVNQIDFHFDEKMWIDFIEKEIEISNCNGMEFICVVSFSTNLKDLLKDKNKIEHVFNYFIEKYKFNENQIKDINSMINEINNNKEKKDDNVEDKNNENNINDKK